MQADGAVCTAQPPQTTAGTPGNVTTNLRSECGAGRLTSYAPLEAIVEKFRHSVVQLSLEMHGSLVIQKAPSTHAFTGFLLYKGFKVA